MSRTEIVILTRHLKAESEPVRHRYKIDRAQHGFHRRLHRKQSRRTTLPIRRVMERSKRLAEGKVRAIELPHPRLRNFFMYFSL